MKLWSFQELQRRIRWAKISARLKSLSLRFQQFVRELKWITIVAKLKTLLKDIKQLFKDFHFNKFMTKHPVVVSLCFSLGLSMFSLIKCGRT